MSNNFDYSIKVSNLNFSYPNSQSLTLENIHLSLVPGSRCLLIGENGSGKSTLLRVLAGRHLTKSSESVELLGRHSFHDTKLNFERVYIDTECSSFTADIPVHSLMKQLQDEYPERRDELIKLLGIDLNWRMHQVSVGERRRIQIFLGLLRPSKIMLLDDVSTCLDITSRNNFIQWLKRESQEREVTIIYATHILDGLDQWPTHILCLSRNGTTLWFGSIHELSHHKDISHEDKTSSLLCLVENLFRSSAVNKFVISQSFSTSSTSSSTASPPVDFDCTPTSQLEEHFNEN